MRLVLPALLAVALGLAARPRVTVAAAPAGFCGGGETVTVCVIGDCLPCRRLESAIGKGVDPFARLKRLLSAADIAIANLEGPLTGRGRAVSGKRFTFRCPPERAGMLARAGVDAVSLANNHIMDYGREGLEDTVRALKERGIQWAGAGGNLDEARKPASLTVRGVRVAFLAYNRTYPKSFWATGNRPGTVLGEESYVRDDVARARLSHHLVIVMMHGGREKAREPRLYQREVARAAIGAGADLFVGTHPHVAQGVERIGGGAAVHSLGDGVFGGAWKRDEDSLVLRALFTSDRLAEIELFALNPSVVDTGGAPYIREGEGAREFLEGVRNLSAGLGTRLELARSAEGKLCLRLRLEGAPSEIQDRAENQQAE